MNDKAKAWENCTPFCKVNDAYYMKNLLQISQILGFLIIDDKCLEELELNKLIEESPEKVRTFLFATYSHLQQNPLFSTTLTGNAEFNGRYFSRNAFRCIRAIPGFSPIQANPYADYSSYEKEFVDVFATQLARIESLQFSFYGQSKSIIKKIKEQIGKEKNQAIELFNQNIKKLTNLIALAKTYPNSIKFINQEGFHSVFSAEKKSKNDFLKILNSFFQHYPSDINAHFKNKYYTVKDIEQWNKEITEIILWGESYNNQLDTIILDSYRCKNQMVTAGINPFFTDNKTYFDKIKEDANIAIQLKNEKLKALSEKQKEINSKKAEICLLEYSKSQAVIKTGQTITKERWVDCSMSLGYSRCSCKGPCDTYVKYEEYIYVPDTIKINSINKAINSLEVMLDDLTKSSFPLKEEYDNLEKSSKQLLYLASQIKAFEEGAFLSLEDLKSIISTAKSLNYELINESELLKQLDEQKPAITQALQNANEQFIQTVQENLKEMSLDNKVEENNLLLPSTAQSKFLNTNPFLIILDRFLENHVLQGDREAQLKEFIDFINPLANLTPEIRFQQAQVYPFKVKSPFYSSRTIYIEARDAIAKLVNNKTAMLLNRNSSLTLAGLSIQQKESEPVIQIGEREQQTLFERYYQEFINELAWLSNQSSLISHEEQLLVALQVRENDVGEVSSKRPIGLLASSTLSI